MNTKTTNTLRVIAAAFLYLVSAHMQAQNTFTPQPLTWSYTPFKWDTAVFVTKLPSFALGHQWGAASLDKVNTALKMTVTNGHFGYMSADTGARPVLVDNLGRLDEVLRELYDLGEGRSDTSLPDTNYVMWGSPLVSRVQQNGINDKWIGMRWEAAENGGLDRTWTPRDDDAWPFTFAAKHHGTIDTSISNVNYRRYKLDYDTALTYPVKVLDSVEPRDRLFLNRKVNWADNTDPLVSEGADTSDVRRMLLVLNLRRTNSADTVVDDSVVASIVVPYQLRWKDQEAPDIDSARHRMPFTQVPYTTADSIQFMPLGRGKEIKRHTPTGDSPDSILITRRMLPRHTAPGGPDITIVAEFRTDSIKVIAGGVTTRRPHVLKNAMFDYPSDATPDDTLLVKDISGYNKRYMAIDTLGVTIHYHGTTTAIAIRAASLLTPQTYRATCGHNDVTWGVGFKAEVDSIKKVQQLVYGDTARALSARRTIKVLGFYTCDEFDIEHLLGMRYRLELLDRRLTSET